MKLQRALCLLLSLCLFLPLAACGDSEAHNRQLFAMDTVMSLTAYGKNGESGLDSAIGVINSLDAMLDPESGSSEIYKLNHSGGEGVAISGQVAEMIRTAYSVYELSGGALDLTIYPLIKAWGFVDANYRVPTEEEIESLMEKVDFSRVSMTALSGARPIWSPFPTAWSSPLPPWPRAAPPNTPSAPCAAPAWRAPYSSLGGNVQTLGVKPDGSNWNIAIQDPENTEGYTGILSLGECAVVTSGGYQRYFYSEDNVRYSHIIDPATGMPADNGILSATVVAQDGVLADALSTTMCVLGEDAAKEYYLTNGGFEMVLITDDGGVLVTYGLMDAFELTNADYTVEIIR